MQKSFLYSNGVVAGLSNNFLSKENYLRMIDANSSSEVLNILQEKLPNLTIESSFEIENFLNEETKNLINFIKNESPVEELTSFFLLPYDYNNVSLILKGEMLGQNLENFIEAEGFYEIKKIKDILKSKNYDSFNNEFIKKAINEVMNLSSKPIKGDEIDFIFKKYLYKNLIFATSKNSIIKKMLYLKVDIENISTAMRASTQYHLEQQLLDFGNLDKKTLLEIFKKSKDALLNIKDEILEKFIKISLTENKENAYTDYEKLKILYPLILLEKFKNDVEGIGPFAYYCFKKVVEIKNIRLIFSFKNNDLSDKIKKRFLE